MPARWLGAWLVAASLLCRVVSAAEPGATPARPVVFVSPGPPELDAALLDALTAQLSGTGAAAVFERFSFDSGGLRRQVDDARSLAAAHQAAGVFWLDAQSETEWLLYLAEPGGDRVLVRRVTTDAGAVAAAVEAIAVITRESSEALLSGQTIGMQPVSLPPTEPAASDSSPAARSPRRPRAPAEPHRPLRIAIGYSGDSPSKEVPWQSGVHVSASFRWPVGVSLGIGYAFFRDTTVRASNVAFRVARSPFDARIGMAFGASRLVPTVELRGIVELQSREDLATSPPLRATESSTRVAAFASPRVGVEYTLTPMLALHVAVGADFALNRFSYVSRGVSGDQELLSPRLVRPAAEAGVVFRP